ncbi:MAG: hypothetical protein M0Q52_11065 [Lascolabacillus sp.]|nr:hypothetical protein [Lascolabacillus sp.]
MRELFYWGRFGQGRCHGKFSCVDEKADLLRLRDMKEKPVARKVLDSPLKSRDDRPVPFNRLR